MNLGYVVMSFLRGVDIMIIGKDEPAESRWGLGQEAPVIFTPRMRFRGIETSFWVHQDYKRTS